MGMHIKAPKEHYNVNFRTASNSQNNSTTMSSSDITIPFEKLYFAYWWKPHEVSKLVVPIKNTPHYRFAAAALKEADPVSHIPQGTGYELYARWEAYCMKGGAVKPEEQMHSEIKFAKNIKEWKQKFDTTHKIEVFHYPAGFYIIADGAHRAAFLAAKGESSIKATVSPLPENVFKGIDATKAVLSVERIEQMEREDGKMRD